VVRLPGVLPALRVRLSCRGQPPDRHRGRRAHRPEGGADAAWQRSGPDLDVDVEGRVTTRSLVKTGYAGMLATQITSGLRSGQKVVLARPRHSPADEHHQRQTFRRGWRIVWRTRWRKTQRRRTRWRGTPRSTGTGPLGRTDLTPRGVGRLSRHRRCLDPAQRATPANSLPEWAAASVMHGSRCAPPS
jgi:hypothetical protein